MKRGREGGNGKRRCLITVPWNRLREIPRERRRPRTGCANFSLPPNRYTFCALLRAGPSSPIETTPLLLLGTHVVNLKCALLLQR